MTQETNIETGLYAEGLYKQETGNDATITVESYHSPGRYNTYYEDDYVEWLESKLRKMKEEK